MKPSPNPGAAGARRDDLTARVWVEALYTGEPVTLPTDNEGHEMRNGSGTVSRCRASGGASKSVANRSSSASSTVDHATRLETEDPHKSRRLRPRFGVNDHGPGSWLVMLCDGSDSFWVGGDFGVDLGSDRGWWVEQLAA